MPTLTRFVAAVLTAAVVPACSVIASSVAHADPVATTATVLKVVDGDTVDIVDDIRGRLGTRLLGIDTPETKKPGFTVGCWGPQASEFAKSTLLGQRVAFVTDPSQGMYGCFGRTYLHSSSDRLVVSRCAMVPKPRTSMTSSARTSRHGCLSPWWLVQWLNLRRTNRASADISPGQWGNTGLLAKSHAGQHQHEHRRARESCRARRGATEYARELYRRRDVRRSFG